jgi:hypothetical protein
MGSYISSIESSDNIDRRFLNFPLANMKMSKIKEFHGFFKSVCDNYAISLQEFEIIFNHT